ncbi:radical SAM protein [Streptomyces sp. NEAU-Y11]|uniref:radical SAM protein n=1 Tax=Streptomyces cucumeris TaxID=2962890 RepID=UPI0020C8719E|nr:radical SAM protein [Streptomyces sp. NEAU-Y11]MCP9210924.1 radical SAM protein [Streptomyces sp. NEAU-Y11]
MTVAGSGTTSGTAVTAVARKPEVQQRPTELLWLDLTRKCQLRCGPCFNSSGPEGTHGTMTRQDWISVIDQAAEAGVRRVTLIGGEPTLHPDGVFLVERALKLGLSVELYSNLVHLSPDWWRILRRTGVSLATSYYSDRAKEHNAVTGRPSHARTLANIRKAVRLGIPVRAGIVATTDTQRVDEARRELEALGVKRISVDHVRPFGRGSEGAAPDVSGLCGRCGSGRASIGPDGGVSPCVFSAGWMGVGNVQDMPLAAILGGDAMTEANVAIRAAAGSDPCDPDDVPDECSPGFPGSECTPRN